MARYDVPPTKSNLFAVQEQLAIAREGFELLEQKREILIMELMRLVEEVKLLERDLDKRVGSAYGALQADDRAGGTRDRAGSQHGHRVRVLHARERTAG